MALNIEKIKEIRKAEITVNTEFFIICAIVTLAAMSLMVVNFFSRGAFLPTRIGFFYLTVVLIYSLHKEIMRWLGEKKSKRRGEYFVYAWVLLTTALYVVNFFSQDYYSYSKEGYPLNSLADVAYTTIEILGVFIITRVMKIFFLVKK